MSSPFDCDHTARSISNLNSTCASCYLPLTSKDLISTLIQNLPLWSFPFTKSKQQVLCSSNRNVALRFLLMTCCFAPAFFLTQVGHPSYIQLGIQNSFHCFPKCFQLMLWFYELLVNDMLPLWVPLFNILVQDNVLIYMPDTELCKKGTDGLKTRLTLVLLKDPCRCSGQKIFCSFNIRTNSVGSLQPLFITYCKLTGYTMV